MRRMLSNSGLDYRSLSAPESIPTRLPDDATFTFTTFAAPQPLQPLHAGNLIGLELRNERIRSQPRQLK